MKIGLLSSENNGRTEIIPAELDNQDPVENCKAWIWANKDLLISTGLLTEEYFNEKDITEDYLILVIPCRYTVATVAVEDIINRLKEEI